MGELLFIWFIIFVLYLRTIRYNYVIDDNVKRSGYMYEVPLEAPPIDFYLSQKPSVWYRLFMISMHAVNATIVYLLWGFAPALLFALHPMSVWGVAWVTGNYYATTTFFTLVAFYFIHTFPNLWGALAAMPFFVTALNSTVNAINFPFLFLFGSSPWGLLMFLPLAKFLTGKKFTTGLKIRKEFHTNKEHLHSCAITPRRLVLMVKVVGLYVFMALYPEKMGFFNEYARGLRDIKGVYDKWHRMDHFFWASLALIAVVFGVGLTIHPLGTLWFFVFISLHSQFNLTGQFVAQRYLYLPLIGLCVVLGTALAPYPILLTILATVYAFRSHMFIPVWKNQERVWLNDMETYGQMTNYNSLASYLMSLGDMGGKKLKNWMLNYIGFLLFKAEEKEDCWEVQMNIAVWFICVGHYQEALNRSVKARSLLEPLGGISSPIERLNKQIGELEKIVKQQAGATLSPDSPEQSSEKVGRENG